MGRAALFPCCASEPLLDSAQVVSQPSPKPSGKKGPASGRKQPPPPIVPTREPLQARNRASSSGSRPPSNRESSPNTPLKRSGSVKGKRLSAEKDAHKELLPIPPTLGAKVSPKTLLASSPKPPTPNKAVEAFEKPPEPEPDTPISATSPLAGTIAKSDRTKRRRQSHNDKAKGPVEPPCLGGTWSEPKLVRAPVVESGSHGEPWIHESDFVMLRPLPYEPIPGDLGDNNRPRTFVYKGALIQVPLLALPDGENGGTGTGSVKPGKKEDQQLRQNKGWKVVKSKVVGGAIKAT